MRCASELWPPEATAIRCAAPAVGPHVEQAVRARWELAALKLPAVGRFQVPDAWFGPTQRLFEQPERVLKEQASMLA